MIRLIPHDDRYESVPGGVEDAREFSDATLAWSQCQGLRSRCQIGLGLNGNNELCGARVVDLIHDRESLPLGHRCRVELQDVDGTR